MYAFRWFSRAILKRQRDLSINLPKRFCHSFLQEAEQKSMGFRQSWSPVWRWINSKVYSF